METAIDAFFFFWSWIYPYLFQVYVLVAILTWINLILIKWSIEQLTSIKKGNNTLPLRHNFKGNNSLVTWSRDANMRVQGLALGPTYSKFWIENKILLLNSNIWVGPRVGPSSFLFARSQTLMCPCVAFGCVRALVKGSILPKVWHLGIGNGFDMFSLVLILGDLAV